MSYTDTIQLQPVLTAADSKTNSNSSLRLNASSSAQSGPVGIPTLNAVAGGGTAPPIATTTAVTPQTKRRETIVLATLYWCLFLIGWNDATLGPLLPRVQNHYQLGFVVVSLLFICSSLGSIAGSFFNVFGTDRFGFGKMIIGGALLQILGFAVMAPAPPFAVMCIAMGINGLGGAIIDAQSNALVASIKDNESTKMGLLHAAYGAGALAAPLVSTQFAQLDHWSFHYLASLGLGLISAFLLTIIFRGKVADVILTEIGSPPDHAVSGSSGASEPSIEADRSSPSAGTQGSSSNFGQMMRLKTLHLMTLFIFIYVGVEVTIGGWIVTFIIQERQGGPSSGYISAGFWGGLTAGRILLLWVNKKIGEQRVIYLYTLLCIALEFTIWFVPSLIGNAVAVSLVGVLLGPFFPICMSHCAKVLPRKLLSASIGWIAGFGQVGAATIPFITGALAGKFTISALQPLLIAMMVLMGLSWFLVPSPETKDD